MACGTACVLTSEGGVNEYARDDENCLMVRPRDNEAMAKSILALLHDDALRARLCRAGLDTAKQYCHRDEARLHLQLYTQWLQDKYGESRSPMSSRRVRRDAVLPLHARPRAHSVVPAP